MRERKRVYLWVCIRERDREIEREYVYGVPFRKYACWFCSNASVCLFTIWLVAIYVGFLTFVLLFVCVCVCTVCLCICVMVCVCVCVFMYMCDGVCVCLCICVMVCV